ncbi:MAG: alpha-amylase family glycosyl hydrolase [Chthoniobacterales bacterium]
MKKIPASFVLLFVLPVFACAAPGEPLEGAEPYLGWIPMQPAAPGEKLEIDMRRFFYPGADKPLALHAPAAEPGRFVASYDSGKFLLTVVLDKNATGLVEIPLRAGEGGNVLEGVLLVGLQTPTGHTFRFLPPDGASPKVCLAGQFNGWNTDSHELTRAPDGTYELFVPLPPGRHPYKLIVDGQWNLDPANPEKTSDGVGGENSVVSVEGVGGQAAPVVFARSTEDGRAVFRVVGGTPATVSSILQLPGGGSRTVPHEVTGETVSVATDDAPRGSWVRVVVADAAGQVSNAARAPVQPLEGFQWQDGVIYYAFTDRFANGDTTNDKPVQDERVLPPANYQGGDFQGIQRKIEEGYFEKLGVNVLWLAPINRNPDGAWQEYLEPYRHYTGYHGYWPVSHTEVEPRFGGEEALKEMVAAAHGKGTFIIADLVLKHVHTDHPMWTEQRELFGSLELPDGTKNLRQWDDHQFTTWFEEWLPGFDFEDPEAVDFLLANAVDFATRFNLDGYRLDAVKHIVREFWWDYRTAMRNTVDKNRPLALYSVGETFMDRRGIVSFVGPNMLDGQFDFPLYDTIIDVFAKESAGFDELEKSLAASESIYGKETLMSPLLGNHDKARFMAYADGDLPHPEESDEEEVGWKFPPKVDDTGAFEKLKLGLTFVLSVDGVPMIYYGDEIGMSGAGDPDNRRMMRWGDGVTPEENAVREHFSKVAAVRHKHPALRYGSRRPLVAEGDRYAFVRAHLGDGVLAAWNRGKTENEFEVMVGPEMPDGAYADALSGERIDVKDGKAFFRLGPMRSALFVAADD